MNRKNKKKSKKKNKKTINILILFLLIIVFGAIFIKKPQNNPEDTLKKYISYINNKEYEKMYDLISENSKKNIEKETYLTRNKNIYEGIEANNLEIKIVKTTRKGDNAEIIYNVILNTIAGEINFSNKTNLIQNENKEYKIEWSSNEIFPDLKNNYKIRVNTLEGTRGKILDKDGNILAGKQTASQIGLVPGKMNKNTNDIDKIATLLNISKESIEKEISASYVKEDTFVPLRTIRKSEQALKNQLLEIKGIKIIDKEERIYPLGESTSHLLGYVQPISEEELKEKKKEGYNENSIIGKSGLEKVYEEKLRSINGAEIYIENEKGEKVKTLAKKEMRNGEDLKLTIDSKLQKNLYEKFKEDKSAQVAINPKTGEILALISTPTFDSNDFSLGMTTNKWNELIENENKPLYNRYLASFTPGSSIKPIIGAIGLTLGSFSTEEDFGAIGLKWQKDSSWGDFYITTLNTYPGKSNLVNAMIYSDNIYFAKAALKIGKEQMAIGLENLGFGKEINFMQENIKSSYSNTNKFSSDKQLANSGYGQGEMLVNPIHVAMIYSSFANRGNMINPYIEYKDDKSGISYYSKNVFKEETAEEIKNAMIQVVENANGTAHNAKIDNIVIAGKTGTAEIKISKEDNNGTEIGWFNSFIVDENNNKQILIISMVEDVKGRGGSHYLVEKIKEIYSDYLI